MFKDLNTSIRFLKGIGPKRSVSFAKQGLHTIEDILYYFPRRYEDRTNLVKISKLEEGRTYTIKAQVLARGQHDSYKRRGFNITEVAVEDNSGKIFCVWFNQPYLKGYFKVGQSLILYGKVERYAGRLQMNSPEFELVSAEEDESLNIGRIVPVYPLPEGVTERHLRRLIKYALDEYLPKLNDFLPFDIRSRNGLLNLAKSLLNIHFPEDAQTQKEAYRRLSFEEFFIFQLPLLLGKSKRKEKPGIAHKVEGELTKAFIERLPFSLTASQERVIGEIKSDMALPKAMQRLLQGDVGSGKTVVATIAAITAIQGGYQVAFMVPTEILARQHYKNITAQVSGLKVDGREINIGLLTGSVSAEEKKKALGQVKDGKIDLLVGTHALLEEDVGFNDLGLVIIDEQHKFGVSQRALLPKKGPNPDVLIMTATPIPRTLAITLYGEFDISIIDELPAGRIPVSTMHFTEESRDRVYAIAKEQLSLGHQVYIVYPVIEESYALDILGAKKMYEQLKSREFKDYKLGLIHGRLKQKEQDEIMLKFKERKMDALVSTTVLEVGIDIPNATCMLIEHAERFGLAQLHQLRGRVGRGGAQSFCILVSNTKNHQADSRLKTLVKYSDGFRIAEEDLKIRGPGEFFGRRQHGLSELRIANPLTQMQLLKRAREEAVRLINADPHLGERQHTALRGKLLERFPQCHNLIM